MIAKNIRKHPAAAALQGVLKFGRGVWALERPSTRVLRAIRASRAKLIANRAQVVSWVNTTTPQWVKDAMMKAKKMAATWKAAQMELPFETVQPMHKSLTEIKRQAAANARTAKHAGLIPCFVRLVKTYWMYECHRNQTFGGYRQMYGFIESENRCPKTQQYKCNAE